MELPAGPSDIKTSELDVDAPNRVHPTVGLGFVVRGSMYPIFLLLDGVHMWRRPEPGRWLALERAGQLQEALADAEAATAAKSIFLANMSHELRTPLNSIIGFTKILLRNRSGTIQPVDLVYLSRVSSNGTHLLNLINGVLDISRIEAASEEEIDLSTLDLTAVVLGTLNEIEPQADARGVCLIAQLPRA